MRPRFSQLAWLAMICRVKARSGLQATLPLDGKAWGELRKKDLAGRLAAIHDPACAAELIAEGKHEGASKLPLENVFFMGTGDSPDYTVDSRRNLAAIAAETGEHWVETFLRLSRETEGRGLFQSLVGTLVPA